jgi:hypothetical protein
MWGRLPSLPPGSCLRPCRVIYVLHLWLWLAMRRRIKDDFNRIAKPSVNVIFFTLTVKSIATQNLELTNIFDCMQNLKHRAETQSFYLGTF